MKKFLLSIFCCLMAFVAVQAENATFTCGTDITSTTASLLNGDITLSCGKVNGTAPAYNSSSKELRLYYGSNGTGAYIDLTIDASSAITINSVEITASSTSYTPSVGYYIDGGDKQVGAWSGTKMTIGNIAATKSIRVQNVNTSNKQLRIKSIKITYSINTSATPTLETPVISPESCNFNEGETLSVTIEAEDGATIYYTTDGSEPTNESSVYGGAISITKSTVVKAFAAKEGCNDSKIVTEEYTMIAEGEIVDVLTRETTGVKSGSTNYSAWTGKKATSSAVYAGNSAGSNDAIQLRSNNNNSGVVTTTSGGKARKIVVEWQSSTSKDRTLLVYGKNSAYSAADDLYSSSTQGTKLGEIKCGTSTELIINGDYEYIGLCSSSGAMYLTSVEITWEAKKTESFKLNVTSAGWATLFLSGDAKIPADVTCYVVSAFEGNYAILVEVEDVLPAETAVLVEAKAGDYLFELNGEKNTYSGANYLEGTAENAYITGEAYVLSAPDGKVGLYKTVLTDGKFLNNANKAYLPASVANGAANYSFSFDWNGTTGIDNIEIKNPMAEGAIYDLTGRKINKIAVSGIYIIDGKKVFVRK